MRLCKGAICFSFGSQIPFPYQFSAAILGWKTFLFAISYNIYSLGLYGSYLLVTGINGEVLTESVAMSSSAGRNENICLRALDSQTLRIGTAVILVEQVFAFCQLQRVCLYHCRPEVYFFFRGRNAPAEHHTSMAPDKPCMAAGADGA